MVNGNGYDKLEGQWLTYYKVGSPFTSKVKPDDREDFLHDLFLDFARVQDKYDQTGKELTEAGLKRVARYAVAQYWRDYYHDKTGVDCGRCSNRQRHKCEADNTYGSKCPRAIYLESLDKLVEDSEGNKVELNQLIADDNADFVPRLEAKLIVQSYPQYFVQLAYKKYAGYQLSEKEYRYYYHQLKKAQKTLV